MHFDEDDEENESDFDDAELPDESDMDDPDDPSVETDPCPYCGASIHYESQRCPGCGKYISAEDSPPTRKPAWFLFAAIACLIMAIIWAISVSS